VGYEALRLSRQPGQRVYAGWALYVLGEVETRRSVNAPIAETLHRGALALVEELGMRALAQRCRPALEVRASVV
jgi:hypothetical protein